jgi:hypothetical protein
VHDLRVGSLDASAFEEGLLACWNHHCLLEVLQKVLVFLLFQHPRAGVLASRPGLLHPVFKGLDLTHEVLSTLLSLLNVLVVLLGMGVGSRNLLALLSCHLVKLFGRHPLAHLDFKVGPLLSQSLLLLFGIVQELLELLRLPTFHVWSF